MEQPEKSAIAHLSAFLCVLAFCIPPSHAAAQGEQASARDLIVSYQRAVDLFESDEPRRGLALLHQILLVLDSGDDALISLDDGTRRSLKTVCMDRLRQTSDDQMEFYENQFGPEANEQLATARRTNDLSLLESVSRNFFYTAAGTSATRELALRKLDRGDALGAAMTWSRFQQHVRRPKRFEPGLSVRLATALMKAGFPTEARNVVADLRKQGTTKIEGPAGDLLLGGTDNGWPDWLPAPDVGTAADDWPVFLGNMQRSRESAPAIPRWKPLWKINTLQTLVVETEADRLAAEAGLKQMSQNIAEISRRQRSSSLVPAPTPLVVGDRVLFRSPLTMSAIRARGDEDYAAGELEWETYKPDPYLMDAFRQAKEVPGLSILGEESFRYAWQDFTSGTMTSDGSYVFVVEETDRSLLSPRRALSVNGRPNYLRAYELASGSVAWQIGGEGGIRVAGMRDSLFLGPPIPFGDDLLLIVASRDELRLLQIHVTDPSAPQPEIRLVWSQQIGRIDVQREAVSMNQFVRDRAFRLGGLSPSFSRGVLVCPTASGEIIALQPGTRSLLWQHRYEQRGANLASTWGDSIPRIVDDSVVCSPAGTDKLFCLDLHSGKRRWTRQRPSGSYVVTTKDAVICIGTRRAIAYGIEDGTELWPKSIRLEQPSGRGLLHDHRMSVPLIGGRVLTFNIRSGLVLSTAQTGIPLGNLIAIGDLIVSQSPTQLVAFAGADSVRQEIAAGLRLNPDSPEFLIADALGRLQLGDVQAGLQELKKAARKGANAEATRLLTEAVFSLNEDQLLENLSLLDDLEPTSGQIPIGANGRTGPLQTLDFIKSRLDWSPQLQSKLAELRRIDSQSETRLRENVSNLIRIADSVSAARFVIGSAGAVSEPRYLASQIRQAFAAAPEQNKTAATAIVRNEILERLDNSAPESAGQLLEWLENPDDELLERVAIGLRDTDQDAAISMYSAVSKSSNADMRLRATTALVRMLRERRPDRARELIRELRRKSKTHAASVAALAAWEKDPSMARLIGTRTAWPTGPLKITRTEKFENLPGVSIPQWNPGSSAWTFSHQGTRIIGRDSLLREQFVLPVTPTAEEQHFRSRDPYTIETATTLVLPRSANHLEVYDLLTARETPAMLWEARTPRRTRELDDPFFERRSDIRLAGPVAGRLLIVATESHLIAQDIRTGATVWSQEMQLRSQHIHADDRIVAVASMESVKLFSTFDGTSLGSRPRQYRAAKFIDEQGRGQVLLEPSSGGDDPQSVRLSLFPFGEDEPVWKRDYESGVVVSPPVSGFCSIVTPAGLVQVVRLSDGEVMCSTTIEADLDVLRTLLHVTSDQFIVFTDKPRGGDRFQGRTTRQSLQRGAGPGVHGPALAFDRNSGEVQWQRVLPDSQLLRDMNATNRILGPNLPVLVVYGTGPTYRLLDCRSGEFVFTNEDKQVYSRGGAVTANHAQRTMNLLVAHRETLQIEFPDEESQP